MDQDARNRVEKALRESKARYTEIRLEETLASRVLFRGKNLDAVTETIDRGGIVRVLAPEGGWGTATFNDWDNLARKVEEALACARAVPADKVLLAEVAPAKVEQGAKLREDFRKVPLAKKVDTLRAYNEIMLAEPEVKSTAAVYADMLQTVYYGNSNGAWIVEERPLIDLSLSAQAVRGEDVQSANEGFTIANEGFECALGQEDLARQAASLAHALLDAKPVQAGVYTVIADPRLAGVFVHEAFGHLSEADFAFENEDVQKMMRMGRKFGPAHLSIADSGVEQPGGNLPGTHRFDDEGTPMKRTQLVKEGVLVGRLHSRETAAKLKEDPTGSARAQDFRHPPLVRMRNTFIEPGKTKLEDMFSDVKNGLYACKSVGGQTCLGNFSFSSGYAHVIRNGKKAELVRDVILSGNIFETLSNVSAVGDDFSWYNKGRCGKGGQSMPVGMGSPHIRIENVVVGGKSS
ncbi:MAG TPA: TldD/PmbA family protein [Planctomycetota bacterium]|nr:TldD/PmbA family protein [Planctomycetota bacterium]